MFDLARFVERMFLPSVVLGVALGVAWRYVPVGGVRTALQWMASLLFFMPQPFALFQAMSGSWVELRGHLLRSPVRRGPLEPGSMGLWPLF